MQSLRKVGAIWSAGVVLPLLAVVALAAALRDKFATWWFRVRHSGMTYIVCSRRDGWHDFVVNNLVPIVPERTKVVWFEPASRNAAAREFPSSCRRNLAQAGRPALLTIVKGSVRIVSLQDKLLQWKPHVARDAQVQSQVRAIVAAARERAMV